MQYKNLLKTWNLAGKRVILRADLNIASSSNLDDLRLVSLKPTLDFLMESKAVVILLTHRGRPTEYDPALSTEILVPWFAEHHYPTTFAPDMATLDTLKITCTPGHIILFENLRFFPQERSHDRAFARALAQHADYYVNDAFGALHRTETSLAVLPQLFTLSHRSIGFLVEKELETIDRIMHTAKHPIVYISGGGKMHEKLIYLADLITTFDIFCLCPGLSLAFLHMQGYSTGYASFDSASDALCTKITQQIMVAHKKLYLPSDYQIALNSLEGPLVNVSNHAIPENGYCTSVGPATTNFLSDVIKKAGTIIGNGFSGFEVREETMTATQELIRVIALHNVATIIGGGNTANLLYHMNIAQQHIYLSTGGGALLAYLAHKKLPALEALYII
jgi:phosphoglycerate kinase